MPIDHHVCYLNYLDLHQTMTHQTCQTISFKVYLAFSFLIHHPIYVELLVGHTNLCVSGLFNGRNLQARVDVDEILKAPTDRVNDKIKCLLFTLQL